MSKTKQGVIDGKHRFDQRICTRDHFYFAFIRNIISISLISKKQICQIMLLPRNKSIWTLNSRNYLYHVVAISSVHMIWLYDKNEIAIHDTKYGRKITSGPCCLLKVPFV